MTSVTHTTKPTSDLRLLVRFVGHVVLKMVLVLALPALATAVYATVLLANGDVLRSSALAEASRGSAPIMWLERYFDSAFHHKAEIARIMQPRVAVVGSSRVMQVRDRFFGKIAPSAFYNAGGCCLSMLQVKRTVDALVESAHPPDVILLGVDPGWFESSSDHPSRRRAVLGGMAIPIGARADAVSSWFSKWTDRAQVLQRAWRDTTFETRVREHFPATFDRATHAVLMGTGARANLGGFRNDGSFRYTQAIETSERAERDPSVAAAVDSAFVRSATLTIIGKSSPGAYLATDNIELLSQVIRRAKAAHAQVIAFIPPLSPAARRVYDSLPDVHAYLPQFDAALRAMCEREHVPLFNAFMDGSLAPANDEFMDYMHPSERVMARFVARMYADPQAATILTPFGDATRLANDLAASPHKWQLYDF